MAGVTYGRIYLLSLLLFYVASTSQPPSFSCAWRSGFVFAFFANKTEEVGVYKSVTPDLFTIPMPNLLFDSRFVYACTVLESIIIKKIAPLAEPR